MNSENRNTMVLSDEKKRERLVFFDLIRVFACLCVSIVHFNATISYNFTYTNHIIPNHYLGGRVYLGSIGVSLFFMLSGATQMLTYKEGNVPRYYEKRFLSIFPMFWVAYIVVTVVDFLYYKAINLANPALALYSVVGVDGYLTSRGMLAFDFYKIGEWFLGCILLLYEMFPRLRSGLKQWPIIIVLLSLIIYGIFSRIKIIGAYVVTETAFYLRIPEIIFGMLYVRYRLWEGRKAVYTLIGAIGVFILTWVFRDSVTTLSLTISFSACLFCLFVFVSRGTKGDAFKQCLSKAAGITFPVFLTHHWLIAKMVNGFNLEVFPRGQILMMFISFVLITLFFSCILQWFDKKYTMEMLRFMPATFRKVLAVTVFLGIAVLPCVRTGLFLIEAGAESKTDQVQEAVYQGEGESAEDAAQQPEWMGLTVKNADGFQHLDLCNGLLLSDKEMRLTVSGNKCSLEGWAIDPDATCVAGAVYVQVGNAYYPAHYGKKRSSVAEYFGKDSYLNCGYTIDLDAAVVRDEGQISIHVISFDGTYRYIPVTYSIG